MAEQIDDQWILDYKYTDTGGEDSVAAACDTTECSFGAYSRKVEQGTRYSPGCATCGVVAVDLTYIFEETEKNYDGPVPGCFKVAAAIALVTKSNRDINDGYADWYFLKHMSIARPKAFEQIVEVARGAGLEFKGEVPVAITHQAD